MGDIVTTNAGGLAGLLHGAGGAIAIPKPFEELAKYLNVDDRLNFLREPDNQYDSKAIVIKTVNEVKIGYVPRNDNAVFARLMDAGKLLFGKITSIETKENWVKINIGIYLHE